MQSIHKLFGHRVRQLREEQQLGATDVAALIGCDVSHYYSIERGAHPPSFALLVAIAKTFKVDEADLFIWPGGGLRHDLRERVRLATPPALAAVKAALTASDATDRSHDDSRRSHDDSRRLHDDSRPSHDDSRPSHDGAHRAHDRSLGAAAASGPVADGRGSARVGARASDRLDGTARERLDSHDRADAVATRSAGRPATPPPRRRSRR